LRYTL